MSILDYKIPDDILAKIPDYFWAAFAGELVSVYGLIIFEEIKTGLYGIDFLTGTAAWAETFKATCKKLGIEWLNKYRNNLDWVESDMFDSEICDLIMSKFVKGEDESCNTYYTWLVNRKNTEDSVAYICDEKACEHCIQDESRYCHHTTDIHHAVNFEEVAPDKFMEKIVDDFGIGRYS